MDRQFQVEFNEADGERAPEAQRPEQRSGVLGFALHTHSDEITFDPRPKSLSENQYVNESAVCHSDYQSETLCRTPSFLEALGREIPSMI